MLFGKIFYMIHRTISVSFLRATIRNIEFHKFRKAINYRFFHAQRIRDPSTMLRDPATERRGL